MHALLESYARLNFTVFPLLPNSKRPACKWTNAKRGRANHHHRLSLHNWAIATGSASGVVIIDCDGAQAVSYVERHLEPSPYFVVTPNGRHYYYRGAGIRNSQNVLPYDVRGERGYVVAPPSTINGEGYAWSNNGPPERLVDLPRFNPEWRPANKCEGGSPKLSEDCGPLERQKRARLYIHRLPGATSGAGGHNQTFRAACVLRKEFSLSLEQSWPIMLEYNERCQPPWSEDELIHKLEDAGQ